MINAGNMGHIETVISSLKYDVHIRKISVSTEHRKEHKIFLPKRWLGKRLRFEKHMTFINMTQNKMLKTFLKALLVLKFRLVLRRKELY